ENLTVLIKFKSLDLHFSPILQQSVMNFARRSGKPINRFRTEYFTPNPSMLAKLPRMRLLCIRYCEGFSDQDAIDIARKEHEEIIIPASLLDPATLRRLIKIAQASEHIEKLSVDVSTAYVDRFLASIELREEGNKLIDTSNANSPIIWFEFNIFNIDYYLDCGSCYVNIHATNNEHANSHRTVTIFNQQLSFDQLPSHSFNLERL
ncbi:hypothetical protein PFISCL1PPCAC_24988, partial [Pristionchus fissidentatus]